MRIRFVAVVGCLMCLFSACSTKEDTLLTQRTAFETYLNNQGKTYEEVQTGLYRYIDNMGREGRGGEPQIVQGDQVVIDFALYSFSSGPSQLYYTSLPELQDELGDLGDLNTDLDGFNTQFWPQSPVTLLLGADPLMAGLENGLIGCRQNDEVELYLTHNLGFGDKAVGLVPRETPLVWLITIHEVKKQEI